MRISTCLAVLEQVKCTESSTQRGKAFKALHWFQTSVLPSWYCRKQSRSIAATRSKEIAVKIMSWLLKWCICFLFLPVRTDNSNLYLARIVLLPIKQDCSRQCGNQCTLLDNFAFQVGFILWVYLLSQARNPWDSWCLAALFLAGAEWFKSLH